jgi:hypothetical protein
MLKLWCRIFGHQEALDPDMNLGFSLHDWVKCRICWHQRPIMYSRFTRVYHDAIKTANAKPQERDSASPEANR